MRRDQNRVTREWHISGRRADNLTDDLAIFLQEIATGAGLIAGISDVLPAGGHLSADQFAEAVLRAEGWPEPRDEYTFRPQLVKLFTERYGDNVSPSDYGP
jgi:hypothetical protein